MLPLIPSSGEGLPKIRPGQSFLLPKLLPPLTEKRVQKAFPLHINLIMAWLHLLGFIHFYCSFHCPLLPEVFMKPESSVSGEGVVDPRNLWLEAAVRGGQYSGRTTRRKEGHEGWGEGKNHKEEGWRGLKGAGTGSSLHCLARSSCGRPSKKQKPKKQKTKSRRKPGDSTGWVSRV